MKNGKVEVLRTKVTQLKTQRLQELEIMCLEDGEPRLQLVGKWDNIIRRKRGREYWWEITSRGNYICFREATATVHCLIKNHKCIRAYAVYDDPDYIPESPADVMLKKLERSILYSGEFTSKEYALIFGIKEPKDNHIYNTIIEENS